MKVVVISASPRKIAKTQVFMKYVTEYITNSSLEGLEVKLINLSDGGIDYYTGDGNFGDTTKDAVKILQKLMSGLLEPQFITHFLAPH